MSTDMTWGESLGLALASAGFVAANPKHPLARKWRREIRRSQSAGLIERRRCRKTGYEIGLYRSNEAGIETDPELAYATVCEEHGNVVCHPTLATARASMAVPDWCEDCHNKLYPDR